MGTKNKLVRDIGANAATKTILKLIEEKQLYTRDQVDKIVMDTAEQVSMSYTIATCIGLGIGIARFERDVTPRVNQLLKEWSDRFELDPEYSDEALKLEYHRLLGRPRRPLKKLD